MNSSEKNGLLPERSALNEYMHLIWGQIEKNEPIGRAFGLNDQYQEAIYSLAHFNLSQSKFNEALTLFQTLQMIDQNDRRAFIGCGLCYKNMKEYIRAIECFGFAYVQNPDDAKTAIQIVFCLMKCGKKEEAEKMLKTMELDAGLFSDREGLEKGFHALREAKYGVSETR